MEEYEEKLRKLGVKRVEHLEDVTSDDLKNIGLAELEVRRFMKKLRPPVTVTQQPASSFEEKTKINIPLPSAAFGTVAINMPEAHLKTEYSMLYYECPQNIKHTVMNAFILQMCSAARHRFPTKKELYIWARKERDDRWLSIVCFMDAKDVVGETNYFKNQNILSRAQDIQEKYRDVFRLLGTKSNPPAMKRERVGLCAAEIGSIKKWAEDSLGFIEKKVSLVSGKLGRKEEEKFWKAALKPAVAVCDKMSKQADELASLVAMFDTDDSQKEKSTFRKRMKEKRKTEKRKCRAESLSHAMKKKKMDPSQQKTILDFCTVLENQTNKCIMKPYQHLPKCIMWHYLDAN